MVKSDYKEIIGNDNQLAVFLRMMAKYDKYFCELMADRVDFTLRMEVRADKGELIHCRIHNDGFERPPKVLKDPRKLGKQIPIV